MHYLSECLIIKNESQYLLEHLQKNAEAGIEHFYIYDNYSDTPVADFLRDNAPSWLDKCTIELFRGKKQAQFECYAKFLADHRKETKWCAFFDTDEILEGDLRKLCEESEDVCCLMIRQILHGSNGFAYYDPSKSMTERFQGHILLKKVMYKTVTQVRHVVMQQQHHAFVDTSVFKTKDSQYKYVEWNEECQLHHYYFRSFEEWLIKVKRGNVLTQGGFMVKHFFLENSIADEDRDALLIKYGLKLDDIMAYGAG